jgi:hypothetical protein
MTTLKYGTDALGWYSHPVTPEIKMREERVGQADGLRQASRRVWDITGFLSGASSSAILTAMNLLVTAYNSDGRDLVLVDNDGHTVLDSLVSASALHGTIVRVRPEFPIGEHAQFGALRNYHLVVDADFLLSGTSWGFCRTSIDLQPDGTHGIVVAGEYTGDTLANAQAAAVAQKLAGGTIIVVSEGPTQSDPDTKKVTFTYRYIDTNLSREVMSYSEVIGVQNTQIRQVAHEVLDGGFAMVQSTTRTPARAWQRGRAVGRTGYPANPAFAFPSGNLEDGDTYEQMSPERLAGGLTVYPSTWDRRFVFATLPSIPAPGVPPSGGS